MAGKVILPSYTISSRGVEFSRPVNLDAKTLNAVAAVEFGCSEDALDWRDPYTLEFLDGCENKSSC